MRRGGLLFAALWIGTLTAADALSQDAARSGGWLHDFEQAEAEAARLNRPLLIHFYAEWCGPCRRMDREVFRAPAFLQQLGKNFVAVKIDSDQRPDLVERFSVRGLPTDVIVDPSGRTVARSTGYLDRDGYLGQMARAEARFNSAQKTHVAKTQVPAIIGPALERNPGPVQSAEPASPIRSIVGLSGYSPVSLWNWREWRKGDSRFAAEYQGITFHMATADELRQFQADPEQYVPKLLGCDPVVMAESDRAVEGSTKFGAYYNGELYLFATAENRQQFKAGPERFTRTRHVLKVDDIDAAQLH